MAHMVEQMMYVGAAPWHRLGVPLDNPPTVEEAIRLAGLDWRVALEPLWVCDNGADGQPQARKAPAFATIRTTDRSILGVVGPHYRPLQNAEAFAWFQPFLDAGQASIHTAGSLAAGRRVWVLARLNRDSLTITPGDDVDKYLLLSNGHDGTLAVRVGFTPVRVVCWNTLSMAHGSDASKLIRVRHRGDVTGNLKAIRDVMDVANEEFEATAEQYRLLAKTDISQADVRRYVKRVFAPALDEDQEPGIRMANILASVERLFEDGRGNNLPGVQGTVWAAYNAVTEYLGYERGRTDDGRLNSLWFGEGANLNRRALEAALALAV